MNVQTEIEQKLSTAEPEVEVLACEQSRASGYA